MNITEALTQTLELLERQGALRPTTSLWQADPSTSSAVDLLRVVASTDPDLAENGGEEVVAGHGVQPRSSVVGKMLGREQEQERLRATWAQGQSGQGHVVLWRGEAGIGTSRLSQFVKTWIATTPHLLWECRGTFTTQHTTFYPMMELLQKILRSQHNDTPGKKLQKIASALAAWGLPEEPGTVRFFLENARERYALAP